MPAKGPESDGTAKAFVKSLKRDRVHVTPLPEAATVLGSITGLIQDYTVQPCALKAEGALTRQVHRSSKRNRPSVRRNGGRDHKPEPSGRPTGPDTRRFEPP